MKTFTTLNVASKIKNPMTNEVVEVLKIKKDGTKRIFFKPTINGVIIGRTLWTTKIEAENVAKLYLNRNKTA